MEITERRRKEERSVESGAVCQSEGISVIFTTEPPRHTQRRLRRTWSNCKGIKNGTGRHFVPRFLQMILNTTQGLQGGVMV